MSELKDELKDDVFDQLTDLLLSPEEKEYLLMADSMNCRDFCKGIFAGHYVAIKRPRKRWQRILGFKRGDK